MNQVKDTRLQYELELFDSKPDSALTDIKVLSLLLNRSRASLYRDIEAGKIPPPKKVGRSSRWPVGVVRKLLSEGLDA